MSQRTRIWGGQLFVFVIVFGAIALWPSRAHAYAWMIRHGYTACAQCHADPSGGGLLTSYGRTIGEVVLRTRYGKPVDDNSKMGEFLFGAIKLPDSVLLGGDVRTMARSTKAEGATTADTELLIMQADLQAQVSLGRFRVNGTVGYAQRNALPAIVTHWTKGNVVSRVHWIGYALGDNEEWLVRAGRMNLPFGVRSIEHTLWARTYNGTYGPRTDINAGQEHGLSLSVNKGKFRGEVMAILGNYQLNPDTFRERGYSAYAEYAITKKLTAGASSLITHAKRDLYLQTEAIRHAHGIFGRFSPVEPLQGVHVMATGEMQALPTDTKGPSLGGWGTLAWFFAPHSDLRLDAIYRIGAPGSAGNAHSTTLLAQLHFYL